jgi:hypothetical protein
MAIWLALAAIMEEKVITFIRALPHARTPGPRHGRYAQDLVTTIDKIAALPVPRTRRGFRTQLFARHQRPPQPEILENHHARRCGPARVLAQILTDYRWSFYSVFVLRPESASV